MTRAIQVTLFEVIFFLTPTAILLSVLIGILIHLALRRPETAEMTRLTKRVRNLEADHAADLAQITAAREQIFYLGRLISKLADIMDLAGMVLPDEIYAYLKRQGGKRPVTIDPELVVLIQHALVQFFSLDELTQLAFEVGVDIENLDGVRKEDKARSLVLFMDRRRQLEILVSAVMLMRPNLPFPWVESRGPP
jgi:hypothetical protein